MGQKVHPLGFRLGNVKSYKSNWFIKPNFYSNLLFEDYLIHQSIKKFFDSRSVLNSQNSNSFVITDIRINKKFNHIRIFIYGSSTVSFLSQTNQENSSYSLLDSLRMFVINELKPLYNLDTIQTKVFPRIVINIIESSNLNLNAIFITKCLINDFENRVPFRRAIKSILRKVQKQENLQGIKIKVSGRLNGIEMARSEWVKKGRIPLQTIDAKIEYCQDIAQTIYGILGIKVWIYKGV